MKRTQLVECLSDVESATASNNLTPIMSHIWFTGQTVMAHDGKVAVASALESEFVGAVPPSMLSLLKVSGQEEIALNVEGNSMTIKSGRSKLKLATMPKEDFNFDMPKGPVKPLPFNAVKFVEALQTCLFSVGSNTASEDFMGVIVIQEGNYVNFVGFDQQTLSLVKIKSTDDMPSERFILPAGFCKHVVRLFMGRTEIKARFAKDYAILESGGVTVFGLYEDNPRQPYPVLDVAAKAYPAKAKQAAVKIPDKMKASLERARVVAESAVDKARTKIVVAADNGETSIKLTTVSERGEVYDSLRIADSHPDMTLHIDSSRALEGMQRMQDMYIGKDALVLVKENALFMVSGAES